MTESVRDAVLGLLAAATLALIRAVWRLAERVARLEGRLNGDAGEETPRRRRNR